MSDEIRCKLCDSLIFQQYALKGKDCTNYWYHCHCGCLFNLQIHPDAKEWQSRKVLEGLKGYKDRYEYLVKLYAPFIEEKVYKRNFLDVGFGTPIVIKAMEERGWNVSGIDIEQNEYITGNFEDYDFIQQGHHRYDLIWMSDVLQCFKDPVKAIYKAYNMLNPHGILFINTPNTDLMKRDTIPAWGHWDMIHNRQFISEGILRNILARCDESLSGSMRVLLCDPKINSKRFITWNNMHMIIQKEKIEDNLSILDLEMLANEEKTSKVIS